MNPEPDDSFSFLAEGTCTWDHAGVSLDDLTARGFFADVTAEHRRKAAAYFAKHAAKPQQDLFA